MTNEQIKSELRKARVQHIVKALLHPQLRDEAAEPLEVNTVDALIRMAAKDAELTYRLFRVLLAHAGVSRAQIRDSLKYVCTQAGVRMPLAMFDDRLGIMSDYAASYTTRNIRTYINYLTNASDRDDVLDILDEHFTECEDCQGWEARDEMRGTYDNIDICRSCMENSYTWSDYHDTYIHEGSASSAIDADGCEVTIHSEADDFEWDDDEDCYVHRDYRGRIIGGYHSSKGSFCPIDSPWTQANSFYISKIVDINNPPPRFSRYFGVELEVEVKHGDRVDRARALNDVLNEGKVGKTCFFENDGSLSNGFEIITQPMGLDMHTAFWEWVKDNNLSRGLLSHNTSTCGLHVHVTRNGLTKLQLSKMIAFVNHPDNRPLIEAIARRFGSSYATYSPTKRIGNALRDANGRYEAINTESRKTVEFRMFKGTLKYESILSAIEFVNALVNFCSDQSGYGFKINTESFMHFINKSTIANDTRHLRPYIENKLESQ